MLNSILSFLGKWLITCLWKKNIVPGVQGSDTGSGKRSLNRASRRNGYPVPCFVLEATSGIHKVNVRFKEVLNHSSVYQYSTLLTNALEQVNLNANTSESSTIFSNFIKKLDIKLKADFLRPLSINLLKTGAKTILYPTSILLDIMGTQSCIFKYPFAIALDGLSISTFIPSAIGVFFGQRV
ncbi:hypothetical protein K501DRAFT_276636 [Backusella circina FSU 941]|nr:hypothetical protein K501DRAFT_276636 [Backusella circina FSU 941]